MPEKPKDDEYITFGSRLRVRRDKIDGAYLLRDDYHSANKEIQIFLNGVVVHVLHDDYVFMDVGKFFGFWT